MPSTSGRAATFPSRADKLKFFHELRDLRDRLKQKRTESGSNPEGVVQQANDDHQPVSNSSPTSNTISDQVTGGSQTGNNCGASQEVTSSTGQALVQPVSNTSTSSLTG